MLAIHCYKYFSLLILIAVVAACSSSHIAEPEGGANVVGWEHWQSVYLAGDKVGYRKVTQWQQGAESVRSESLHLTLQQPGAPLRKNRTVIEYRQSAAGLPISVRKQLRGDSTHQDLRAWRENGRWWLESDAQPGQLESFDIPIDFLFPEAVRLALLSQQDPVRQLHYQDWSFSHRQFQAIDLRVEVANPKSLDEVFRSRPELDIDRWQIAWIAQRRNLSEENAGVTLVLMDEQFRAVHELASSGGDEILLAAASESQAQASFTPVTHVYRQLIRSPYRISDSALQGKIRYRLSGKASLAPPETYEQSVKTLSDGWTLTICADCGSEPAPDSTTLQHALASNYWLPSDHPELTAVVAEVLPDREISVESKMRRLTHFVERRITEPSYAGYGTALEGLRSGEGDCTEHALLLAALGRAAGVPTRVVFGLAYNNERFLGRRFLFVPHAWVQAWTGTHWQSFDSGLGEFNAGYIALGISSGEQSAMLKMNAELHRLQIDSAVQLQKRL